MANERLRIPSDPEYIQALGLATYAFARCEWQVVWCCEKIAPGALHKIVSSEMTAGTIAKHFVNIVRNMPKSKVRDELSELAQDFMRLKEERNRIVHGKPCTAPSGAQRLSAEGIIEVDDLERAADSFANCGNRLNGMYYGFLQEYVPK